MRIIIGYISRAGSTRQYAQWLAESLGAESVSLKDRSAAALLAGSDVPVICGAIEMGRPAFLGWLKKHWSVLGLRKPVLVLTSGERKEDGPKMDEGMAEALGEDLMTGTSRFYVGGRYNIATMPFMMRTMLKIAAALTRDPEAKRGMLEPYEDMNRANLDPVIAEIKARKDNSEDS